MEKGINFDIILSIKEKWKWIGQSCWLDALFINIFSAGDTYFVQKMLDHEGNEDLHLLLLRILLILKTNNKNHIYFDQKTRDILDDYHRFLFNSNGAYEMDQLGSIGAIQDLVFRMYKIYFHYWDQSLGHDYTKSTSIHIPKYLEDRKITVSEYIQDYLEIKKNYKMLVFDVSSSNKDSYIPEFITVKNKKYRFYTATIYSDQHYTSVVYDGINYYYVDILGKNEIYLLKENNFKLINGIELNNSGANLRNNSTFLFYYIF